MRCCGTAPKSLNDPRSPLFVAEHSERYERQRMIREYETEYNCRLIVMHLYHGLLKARCEPGLPP